MDASPTSLKFKNRIQHLYPRFPQNWPFLHWLIHSFLFAATLSFSHFIHSFHFKCCKCQKKMQPPWVSIAKQRKSLQVHLQHWPLGSLGSGDAQNDRNPWHFGVFSRADLDISLVSKGCASNPQCSSGNHGRFRILGPFLGGFSCGIDLQPSRKREAVTKPCGVTSCPVSHQESMPSCLLAGW